jgi:hypothetical protein
LFAQPFSPPAPAQEPLVFDRILTVINERMDRQESSIERLRSTQLTVCEQLKDLRASMPMQRRPLSKWAMQIHIEVTNAKRNGLCPCCQEVPVCNEHGRLPGAEYDHFFARNRARAEETWIACSLCNQRLNNPEFKSAARSAFEAYQQALVRVLQARQTAQSMLSEMPRSEAS